MESLRNRKASVSVKSRPKKQQNGSGPPPAKLTRPSKDARKSRVDDKIKKRMSMRYADISGPTGVAGAVPAVPSVPIGLRPGGGVRMRETDEVLTQGPALTKEEQKAAENRLLDAESFDPDAYLKLKLANSTEAELKSLQSSLQASKDDVASDLQRNVFKNYAEFVLISKEIGTLENEMLELKESLAEWKSMPSVLHIDESSSAADRRRNVRSSVADLRILYASQMQALHSQVEGSTKFVPTTPGRHIVAEMDGIVSLNAATYKPVSHVRFVVLDDAVLVARKRKRRNVGEGDKLVAERCWMLNEMLVLDTKDTASMANVFKIRHNKETHVYRAESATDKKNLLSQFRQVAEELAAKRRKEREGEHERRKSLWNSGDRSSLLYSNDVPPMPDWMADLAQQAGISDGAKDKAERDARWIGEFADELTVAIALREWDRAVDLVEQGEAKLSTTPALAPKLTSLTASLTSAVLDCLSSPNNHKTTVVHLISLLQRLHAGPAARSTFLAARGETIRKLVRMIRFEGHIGMYFNDLAVVMFTAIKHTADWFLASFKENEVASCFIDWAKKQIELYAEMFRRQVYSSDVDEKTVAEALKVTHSQSRKLLQEFGLDFRFLLDELLVPNPKPTPTAPKPQPPPSSTPPIIARPTPRSAQASSSNSTTTLSSTPSTISTPSTPSRQRSPAAPSTPVRRAVTPSTLRTASSSSHSQSPGGRASPAPPPRSRDRPGSSAGRSAMRGNMF